MQDDAIARPMTRTYSIGDIHGCLRQLQDLVDCCKQDTGAQELKLIFLGDYIDRGPDSRGVIDFLIDLQTYSPDQIICLMGNHEVMLLDAINNEGGESLWLQNGGIETLRSFRTSKAANIPDEYQAWLRSLPKFYDDGKRFFVHAGVHPDRPLDRQNEHDFLWIREPFLSTEKNYGRLVVHGHTPTPTGLPDQRPNRLNIDTGAVYGRSLTAAVFTDQSVAPQRFVSSQPI
jgi:serine/threonine protein phosphatase 1